MKLEPGLPLVAKDKQIKLKAVVGKQAGNRWQLFLFKDKKQGPGSGKYFTVEDIETHFELAPQARNQDYE